MATARRVSVRPAAVRILYTNNTLAHPAGTELSLTDACLAMQARGHRVAAFSPQLGEIAERLKAREIPVCDRIADVPWVPDVIHGHHEWETSLGALNWPERPVISFCRGPYLWQEAPCRLPNVVLHAAVDEECVRRLVEQEGVPSAKIRLILNGVDLDRFTRRPPLPDRPTRAAIVSNYASEENFVPAVREACQAAGLDLTVIGSAAGNRVAQPETVLWQFDVVFAKGKAALEALATGCAVVVCDSAGLGPLVNAENLQALRRLSFGNPCMTEPITVAAVAARLAAYDAAAASAAADLVRGTCGLSHTIDALDGLYTEALSLPVPSVSGAQLASQMATWLTSRTLAYKLGRKIQEIWTDALPDAPNHIITAADNDRILSDFTSHHRKLRDLRQKVESLNTRLTEAKTRIERLKEGSRPTGKGLFGFLRGRSPGKE